MNNIFRLTVFALVDIISSCSLPTVKLGEITDYYSNEKSESYLNLTVNFDKEELDSYFNKLFAAIRENSSYAYQDSEFVTNFNNMMSTFYKLIDSITINRTKYYDSGEASYKTAYHDSYDLYLETLSTYHDLLDAANHSNYKEVLFSGMSDKEIQDLIDSYETSEEEKQYTLTLEDYSNEANEIYKDYYFESEYEDKMFDLLVKYMKTANEYATYLGESYLEHVYKEDYDRNYTTQDAYNFYASVKSELVPAATLFSSKFEAMALNSSEKKYMNLLDSYNFRYYETDILPALENYVYSIEPLSNAYKNLWSDKGIYCFSNSNDSLGTAYTSYLRSKKQPILFFSKKYQDAFTFVHEFGHYTNAYCTKGGHDPMDISEIDSQANELLFASYLLENYEELGMSSNIVSYINVSQLNSQLRSIINCAYVSEMEQIAYSYDLSDKACFFRKIDEISSSYGSSVLKKYWWAPVLCSFGYYISYATSSIGALQFYINSRSDFSSAANKYSKFVQRKGTGDTIDEVTTSVGLLQIYSEEAVKYVAEYVKKQ